MKQETRINQLKFNHFREWQEVREKTEDELSDLQGMRCACGMMATGMHEMNCGRFQNKVDRATVQKLKHLLSREP